MKREVRGMECFECVKVRWMKTFEDYRATTVKLMPYTPPHRRSQLTMTSVRLIVQIQKHNMNPSRRNWKISEIWEHDRYL